jgi:hypothetical protein
MTNEKIYTVYALNINLNQVKSFLREEKGVKLNESFFHIETFDFKEKLGTPKKRRFYSHHYSKFFSSIKEIQKNPQRHATEVVLEEKNEQCKAMIKNTITDKRMVSIPFPKEQWANIEEELLIFNMFLKKVIEYKTILYKIYRAKALYEIIIRPGMEPYMKISSPYKDRLPEIVAYPGFCINEVEEITEKDIFRRYNLDENAMTF